MKIATALTNLSSQNLTGGTYTIANAGTLQLPDVVNTLNANLSIDSNGQLQNTAAAAGLANLSCVCSGGLTFTGSHSEPTALANVFGRTATSRS